MNDTLHRIDHLQRKLKMNIYLQNIIKGVGVLLVFVIFFCSMFHPETMKIGWLISILVIPALFVINAYYVNENKKYRFEIYQIEVDDLRSKKKIAGAKKEQLPEELVEQKIEKPSGEVSYPVVFYAVLVALDILIRIIMLG